MVLMDFSRTCTVSIAAPPLDVHNLIADVAEHPSWAYNNLEIEHLGGPKRGPGAHYRSTVRDAVPGSKKPVTGDIVVLEDVPAERFVMECTDDGGCYRWTFVLAPTDTGCTVEQTVERIAAPAYVPWIQPAMWRMFGHKQVDGGLQRLKDHAEAHLARVRQINLATPTAEIPQPRTQTRTFTPTNGSSPT